MEEKEESGKKPAEKHKWEGIKTRVSLKNANKELIDAGRKIFKFVYRDEAGNSCEVYFDGNKRVNNVLEDGMIIVIFEPYTFSFGYVTVEQHFFKTDEDFKNGVWEYGWDNCLNLKII
mgnify:CR=1 FL=1